MPCRGAGAEFGDQPQPGARGRQIGADQEDIGCALGRGVGQRAFRLNRDEVIGEIGAKLCQAGRAPGAVVRHQRHLRLPGEGRGGFGEAKLPRGSLPQPQLLGRFARPEDTAQPRQQHHLIQRFPEHFVRPGLKRCHLAIHVAKGGDHHHGDVAGCRIGLQPTADVDAADVRHLHIQQNQVRPGRARQCQRLAPAGRLNRFVESRCELDLQHDPVRRNIIGNKDFPAHGILHSLY